MEVGKHKDFIILLNEQTHRFHIQGQVNTHEAYAEVVKEIDKLTSVKYEPVKALHIPWRSGKISEEVALRPVAGSTSNTYLWVKSGNTRLTKGEVFADTPENRDIAKKMEATYAIVKELSDKVNTMYKGLTPVAFTVVEPKGRAR